MKKIIVATLFVIFMGLNANAQNAFGLKGGLNISSISNLDEAGSRVSFHFGGVFERELSEKFSLQTEVLFSSQGVEKEDEVLKLHYINIPVLAKFYVVDGLSLEAGLQAGIFLLSEFEDDGEFVADLDDYISTFDFGLNFGLGYRLDNGLNFGARYNLGLTNVFEDAGETNTNGVFQVSIGYFFGQ